MSDVRVRIGQFNPNAAAGKIYFDRVKVFAEKKIFDVSSINPNSPVKNPTRQVFVGTDRFGIGSLWLTEKLTYAKSSSPPVIEEINFTIYELTTRSKRTVKSQRINLSSNSTIHIPINIDFSDESLPLCIISQMIDLNNDDNINIQDAIIILRSITGLPVSTVGSKNCAGININPF